MEGTSVLSVIDLIIAESNNNNDGHHEPAAVAADQGRPTTHVREQIDQFTQRNSVHLISQNISCSKIRNDFPYAYPL